MPMFNEISDRNRLILNEIIKDFIENGEPVGSVRISTKREVGLRPASIRNTMSELEDMGFLIQPHTSAGRVPTDKAYRFYINSLLNNQKISRGDRNIIENKLLGRVDIQVALRESSRILSNLCHQASIVMRPASCNIVFKHIEFLKISKGRLLAVMISKTGVVMNKVFEIEEDVETAGLEKMNNYLNSILEGLSIAEVKSRILEAMRQEKMLYDGLLARALQFGADFMAEQPEEDIYIDGTANILGQPEFADIEKMKRIFKTFEEKSMLLKLLDKSTRSREVNIWIGSECGIEEMEGLSLITSSYGTSDRVLGCVGILGPTRMNYSKVIPIVSYTAGKLSSIIVED